MTLAVGAHFLAPWSTGRGVEHGGASQFSLCVCNQPSAQLGSGKTFDGCYPGTRRNDAFGGRHQPCIDINSVAQPRPLRVGRFLLRFDLLRQVPFACKRCQFCLGGRKSQLRRALQMVERSNPALGNAGTLGCTHRHDMRCRTGTHLFRLVFQDFTCGCHGAALMLSQQSFDPARPVLLPVPFGLKQA